MLIIKDMDMPKGCDECALSVVDGGGWAYYCVITDEDTGNMEIGESTTRLATCPLSDALNVILDGISNRLIKGFAKSIAEEKKNND